MALLICFTGIYAVGDHEKQLPDGLSAVENNIAELNVYSGMERRSLDVYSDVYNVFTSQISNCGGHLLEIQNASESEIWNEADCFIEIIYDSPQTIIYVNPQKKLTVAITATYNPHIFDRIRMIQQQIEPLL